MFGIEDFHPLLGKQKQHKHTMVSHHDLSYPHEILQELQITGKINKHVVYKSWLLWVKCFIFLYSGVEIHHNNVTNYLLRVIVGGELVHCDVNVSITRTGLGKDQTPPGGTVQPLYPLIGWIWIRT